MSAPPQRRPRPAAGLLARAAALLRDGRPDLAIAPLRDAARLEPGDAAILHDWGVACLESGRLADAIFALQAAIAVQPRFADAHLRLGIAQEAAGEVDAALMSYRRASMVRPSLADARYREGELLDSMGQTAPAIDAFRRAASSAPKTTLGRLAAARARLLANRDAEAEKLLRQALALDRGNGAALALLGEVLAQNGRFEEARDVLIRAVQNAPARAGLYDEIVRCRPIGPGDAALLDRMRAALDGPALEPCQRSRLHLALGKAADDLGDRAEAMRHFDAAQAWRDTIVRFDPAAFEARIDALIARFPRAACASATPTQAGVPAPILILGLPRSGTTLVEQILSAHESVGAGGELPFWNARGAVWEAAGALNSAACGAAGLLLEAAAAEYRAMLGQLAPGAAFVTDKMPLNTLWAGLIHLALPAATILHCRRRPIDTALSIHRTHFNPRMPFPTGGEALVRYIRATQRLAAHWRETLPAARFIDIEYEALTASPEPAIRAMLAACGLDWDLACLRPEHNSRAVRTPSKWQVRQSITHPASAHWREYEPYLGELRPLAAGEW